MAQVLRRQVVVKETAGVQRNRWPVVVPLADISADILAVSWKSLKLADDAGGPVPFQVDRLGGSGFAPDDEVAFQVDLKPNEEKTFTLSYFRQGHELLTTGDSDLAVRRDGPRVFIENSRFLWELSEAENAEVRIKTADGLSPSWNARTFTLGGQSGATLQEIHSLQRRHRVHVPDGHILTTGAVRSVVDVQYDDVHFDASNDVRRRLIVYSDQPFLEKVSTSVLGEDRIMMATLVGKLGRRNVARMTYCGADRDAAINYGRFIPGIAPPDRPDPLGPCRRRWPSPGEQLGQIEGFTWGAVWNPHSGLGKAEIARIDEVVDFVARWEPNAYHPGGVPHAAVHPVTDRVLGDFEFACTSQRTFRHFQVFLDLNRDGDLRAHLDRLTRAIANPVDVTIGIEALCDTDSPLALAPSQIICDLTGGNDEFDVVLPLGKVPKALTLTATGDVADHLSLPDTTGPLSGGDRCDISVHDRQTVPAGVTTGAINLTINDQHTLSVPITLLKSERPPHGEIQYGPILPTGLDPIRFQIHASADTWLDRIEIIWQRDGGDRFAEEHVLDPHLHEGDTVFEIPAQRPGSKIRCTVNVSDIHGRIAGLVIPFDVLDATLDCPSVVYADEELPLSFRLGNSAAALLSADVRLVLDDDELVHQSIAVGTGATQIIRGAASAGRAGTRMAHAILDVDGRLAALTRQVNVVDRPDLPYEDFVAMLSRPDKRTLHGNLVRYWGGQMCPEHELTERETLGFTHPWYYDGTCYGSQSQRDWEFWRDEFIAYGLIRDSHTGELTIYPPVNYVNWQPGRMDCHYHLDGIAVSETKFITNHDVVANVIHIENTSAKPKRFALLFKGRGHGMSEGLYDAQREAIVVEDHAYAYTGLTKVLYASRPFDIGTFEMSEAAVDKRIREGDLFCCGDREYGNPVWYVFGFDIELAPGETTEIVLGLAIDRDLENGYRKLRSTVASPEAHLEAVQWKWNHWLNYEVPRFDCSDPHWRELYYYLYFCYRANLLDIHRGNHVDPYVAPAASVNFHTQFAWDSAFCAWIGRWVADPSYYTYGNLTNWKVAQEPCGFLPEFFGQGFFSPWTSGHMHLQPSALLDLYRHTGDDSLVRSLLGTYEKYEAWQACEIEQSPYWTFYYANIADWRDRRTMAEAGTPWTVDSIEYYQRMVALAEAGGDKAQRTRFQTKLDLCRQRLKEKLTSDGGEGIAPGRAADEEPTDHGCWLYENHSAIAAERIDGFLTCLQDPDQMWLDLPMPQQSLAHPRSGDIWDLGASVTANYLLTEGLFRAGYPKIALELLGRMIEASFIDIGLRRAPIAPECWNEDAEPWGSIECAWNGLINDFLLCRVVGVQPDVPAKTLTVEPNLPDHLDTVSAVIPVGDHWTTVAHRIDRSDGPTITTTVAGAELGTVQLRYRIPEGHTLSAATVDGQPIDAAVDEDIATMVVGNQKAFEATVRFDAR